MNRLFAHLFRRAVRVYLRHGRILVAADMVHLVRRGDLELCLIRRRPTAR